jgi:hypothetical protein
MGRSRMEERDEPTVRPGAGLGVDEFHSRGLETAQLRPDIGDGKGKVVEAFAAAFHEARDHPVRRQGLEELDADASRREEGDPHPLGGDLLDGFRLKSEGPVPGERVVQSLHRNADVVGGADHTSCLCR